MSVKKLVSPIFSPSDGQVMIDHGPEGDQEERHLASGSRDSSHHSFSIDIGRVGDCFYFTGGRRGFAVLHVVATKC